MNYQSILELTGIQALYPIQTFLDSYGEFEPNIVDIELVTEDLDEFQVRINLLNRTIKNVAIVKKKTSQLEDIGYKLLSAQIEKARRLKFHLITLNAYGWDAISDDYIGYLVWGKLGYQMDTKSKKDFVKLMNDKTKSKGNVRKETSLYKLLSTEEGRGFWKKHGKSWLGEFDLRPNSRSMQIFNSVRKRKGKLKL